MFSEVTTRRSADAVFDQVCEQIVDGSLEPGTTLPAERELAAQLNVSRSVVREALQRLAQAGLVEIRHGGSTRVRDFQSGTDIEMLGRLLVHADGSIDAKVATRAMARSFMGLSGELDSSSKATGFWMRYGTASVNGSPFVWSQSSWKWQKRRDVPDRVDGVFTLMPLHLK